MVQFSHPYMTTGKIMASTIQTFVGKIMSLLFNTLSSFVRAFLPRTEPTYTHIHYMCVHIYTRLIYTSFTCKLNYYIRLLKMVVVQLLSCVWLFVTPWTAAHVASLSFTISQSLFRLMFIEWVMLSNHLILCYPLPLLPSIFPSTRVFSNELALLIRWAKYWRFSFNISPSKEYSVLISFRIDWFDILAVQGTLKSLPQHHSLKASILRCLAFFMVQLSHPYITTGRTFVGKAMSLLFNTC